MANDPKQNGGAPAVSDKCKSEDCKKKQEKFGFCMEHYEWYMEGIIRGDGRKPTDFQEKLSLWKSKKVHKVA